MNLPSAPTLASPWADSVPPGETPLQPLRLPQRADSLAHRAVWTLQALRLQLRAHRLLPGRAGRYGAAFSPEPALREAFAELFDLRHGPAGVDYPFLYAQGVQELLQQRVLADLGVQGRQVQQLRHRSRIVAAAAELGQGRQQLECRLQRAVRVGPTEVLLLLETRVSDSAGRCLATLEDTLLVGALQVAYAVQAEEDDLLRRAIGRLRRRGPELAAEAADVHVRQLYIAPDAGRRFARVSGQHGPAHGPALAARLFAGRRAHVQPMYLRNLVARELAESGIEPAALQLTFVRRAGLGQTLRLLRRDTVFELVDERGRLVAFGKAG